METATASQTISVEVPCARECSDLVEFIEAHGLTASFAETNDHRQLAIGFAPAPTLELKTAVRHALTSWLAEHNPPLVLDETTDNGYVLRPPGD